MKSIGLLLENTTAEAAVGAVVPAFESRPGTFLAITSTGGHDILALVRKVRWSGGIFTEGTAPFHLQRLQEAPERRTAAFQIAEVEFVASIDGDKVVDRRPRTMPAGALLEPVAPTRLACLLGLQDRSGVALGRLAHHPEVDVTLEWSALTNGHTAVVGQTGSGKTNVLRLVHDGLAREAARRAGASYVVFDFHNEFTVHSSEHVLVPPFHFGPTDLNFEVLSELLPGLSLAQQDVLHLALDRQPSKLGELIEAIDAAQGPEASRRVLRRRINWLVRAKAFTQRDDTGTQVTKICRTRASGVILRLAGVRSQVAHLVIASIVRQLVRLQMNQRTHPTVLLVDEAHRLASDQASHAATRSFRFVAQEGRKFGITLVIATQRPRLVDPTVLSQCATFLALRLASLEDARAVSQVMAEIRPSDLGALGIGQGVLSRASTTDVLWLDFTEASDNAPASPLPRPTSGFSEELMLDL